MRQSSYETSKERTPQPCGQLPGPLRPLASSPWKRGAFKGSSQRSILQSFCLDQTGQVEGYDSTRGGSFLSSTLNPEP